MSPLLELMTQSNGIESMGEARKELFVLCLLSRSKKEPISLVKGVKVRACFGEMGLCSYSISESPSGTEDVGVEKMDQHWEFHVIPFGIVRGFSQGKRHWC